MAEFLRESDFDDEESALDRLFDPDISEFDESGVKSSRHKPFDIFSPSPMVEKEAPISNFSRRQSGLTVSQTPVPLSRDVNPYLWSALKRSTPGHSLHPTKKTSANLLSPAEERAPAVSRHHRRSRGSSFSAEVRSALKPMSPVPKHSKLEHLSTTKKPAEKVRFLLDESILDSSMPKLQFPDLETESNADTMSVASEVPMEEETERKGGERKQPTISSMSFKAERHPALAVAQDLFTQFHTHFDACQDPDRMFDLADRYEQSCLDAEKIINKKATMKQSRRSFVDPSRSASFELSLIVREEKYTWRLVSSLYRDRISSYGEDDEDKIIGYDEKRIARSLFKSVPFLREQQIVIDWLEKNEEDNLETLLGLNQVGFSTEKVRWEHTLHELKKKKRDQVSDRLVTEMDPDAPARQGRDLHPEDNEEEASLLRDMFLLVRAGQVNKAQQLCIDCGQPWRAATLEGWRLWHDPNYYIDISNEEDIQPVEGNPNRDIWKRTCWLMTDEVRYGNYQKAIYAALTGNLKHLLPFLHSWSDGVWGYYKVMVDVAVEKELRNHPRPRRRHVDLPESYWNQNFTPEEVFRRIEQNMDDSHDMVNKFHVVQKHIILDDIPGLLSVFEDWLTQNSASAYMLRFMTHLVLFLRVMQADFGDELIVSDIIRHYIKSLISEKHSTLVATYTTHLRPEYQTEVYAELLQSIMDSEEKQTCLKLAGTAGLDVSEITKAVVENVHRMAEDTFTMDATFTPGVDASNLSENDKKKIGAIDWLVFEPRQRAEALKQANSLMRYFLAVGKLMAVREVLLKIPRDSIALIHDDWNKRAGGLPLESQTANAIKEYLSIKAYADAYDAFDEWNHHLYREKPLKPALVNKMGSFHEGVVLEQQMKKYAGDYEVWSSVQATLTRTTADKIYNVLMFVNGGWLVDEIEDESNPMRSQQMRELRKLCLPGLTDLLHKVLHESEMYQEAMQIADIVASQKYELLEVFTKDEQEKLLQLIRKSGIQLLLQKAQTIDSK
ncbi:nuclear pore complex protein Nup107-like [Oscarella lobularis]|uniref:nuclear pore complex protein Nup107-like n=1 Tax=Oscarella lobularis TaxID=121494 RepID=UPI003313335F